jgi:lipid A 3-O-deacylase
MNIRLQPTPMKFLPSLAALAFATTNSTQAQGLYSLNPFPDKDSGYATLYFDNDLFGGDDKDYTNGVRLSWISDDRPVDRLGLQGNLRRFSGDEDSYSIFRKVTGFKDPSKIHYNYGFSLTQLMFTPEDPLPGFQPAGQRRYAGWLGLGFSLHVKDEHILNSVEFTVGMIGPDSLAEESQDTIHDVRDIEKFNGWDDQVPNEVTADVSFVQKRRADFVEMERGAFRIDGLTEWGVRLGTFRTEAHFGGFFRAGYNLPPDFSDPRLSSTAYSHRYFGGGGDYQGNWSVYTLFGANVRGVAHDATLDGPVFRDFDTGNDREPFVAEAFCGLGIRYRLVELSYVHTWRTKEYEEQNGHADFGTVALRVKF